MPVFRARASPVPAGQATARLGLHTDFVNESFIGSRFVGRLLAETPAG